VDYNYNKGHVDMVDQLRSYYVVQRRGERTWPALAWWLMDMCINNAYKLWCMDTNTKPGLLRFREQLLEQIAAAHPSQHTHVQPAVTAQGRPRDEGHWPVHTHQQLNCVHCSGGSNGRKRSEVQCEVCKVHLCMDPCFKQYHVGQ
jgi:hypothetical protein